MNGVVKWFFDNFPMFADSFSVLSIHCVARGLDASFLYQFLHICDVERTCLSSILCWRLRLLAGFLQTASRRCRDFYVFRFAFAIFQLRPGVTHYKTEENHFSRIEIVLERNPVLIANPKVNLRSDF